MYSFQWDSIMKDFEQLDKSPQKSLTEAFPFFGMADEVCSYACPAFDCMQLSTYFFKCLAIGEGLAMNASPRSTHALGTMSGDRAWRICYEAISTRDIFNMSRSAYPLLYDCQVIVNLSYCRSVLTQLSLIVSGRTWRSSARICLVSESARCFSKYSTTPT